MPDVYIVAVGMIPFGKYPDHGIKDLTATVVKNLLPVSRTYIPRERFVTAWASMQSNICRLR